tara:strand:- start:736 stop:1167 length:432 start_codon:yes stop_codon:yes gene_type:complete
LFQEKLLVNTIEQFNDKEKLMKINEFVEAEFDPEYNPEFDRHGKELDSDDGDDLTNFKQEAMQVQLMKISDSADDENIKNPVRTVVTDDGKTHRVEHNEAEALLRILGANIKPQTKIKIMKDMQTSKGLDTMLAFVHKNKYVK